MASLLHRAAINSNISSTCPHNMANFCRLMAEIGSGVWDTPANFNGFRVLPSLLQRHCSPEANHTMHNVWPSSWLVHYIYIFAASCPLMEVCPVQNLLYVQVLHSAVLAALLHSTPTAGVAQTLQRTVAEGATYIRLGGHHVGHRPTL